MTILVTGGAGYIGSHVCKLLKVSGFNPICFDNLSTGHENAVKWGPFIKGDLNDIEALRKLFEKNKIEAVFHLAANALVSESMKNPLKYYKNNVSNTLNLLQTMLEFNVKKIIFSSSCAVFGIPKNIPITEKSEKNPISPYGKSKLMIENILKDFENAYNLSFISLRYFNAAGADIDGEIGENHRIETHLIPLAIKAILNKNTLNIYGNDYPTKDGTAIRDYIHVTDLADAHIKALNYLLSGKKSLSINLGTCEGFSILEIIKAIEKFTELPIKVNYKEKREGDPPILFANNSKAKEILEWTPKHSNIKTIIESAYHWHKSL